MLNFIAECSRECMAMVPLRRFRSTDVIDMLADLFITPMFHVHACGMPYIATMLGLKQVYPGRYDTDMICKLRTEHGVTYSHGVPTVLQMVIEASTSARNILPHPHWSSHLFGSLCRRFAASVRGEKDFKC